MQKPEKLTVKRIKKDFPLLERKINKKPIVYLDNAAASQKPIFVINKIKEFYLNHNSNIHRGIHKLSEESTISYEKSREKIAKFINCQPQELIFTSGTTESLNIAAFSICKSLLKPNDEIILTPMEHHSNIVPWIEAAKIFKLKIIYAKLNQDSSLNFKDLESKITEKTKVISITHISNVTGAINPIKEITKLAHKHNILIVVDGAQAAPHIKLDMKNLGVDFYAFSGQKMLGPTGTGCLFGKKQLLEKIQPSKFGGGMIKEVTLKSATWADLPQKFEAGTPNIAGQIALGEAVRYLKSIGLNKIENYEKKLTQYTISELSKIKELKIIGPEKNRAGVISFTLNKIHPHDIATILDKDGIAVRAGHHCCMPLMNLLKINGTTRASLYFYNTAEDIIRLKKSIQKTIKLFA